MTHHVKALTPKRYLTLYGPLRLLPALGLVLLLGSGCVYRMNIQQGNSLQDSAVSQLQVGMTRSQVRYLLGTPMVPDAFDDDRWDYVYYLKKGRLQEPEQRHLTVYFAQDKVARIEREGMPAVAAAPASATPAPEAKDAPAAAPLNPAPTVSEIMAPVENAPDESGSGQGGDATPEEQQESAEADRNPGAADSGGATATTP